MDHTLIPNYSKKILTSILNSYKLGVENGNIENYQNTDGTKAMIEKICQLEEDFKKEYELAQGFDCDSLTNFDIAAQQMLGNYQRDRPLAKNSERYENLAKDIDDIKQALDATFHQAEATQNMTEVDGMQMQSTITKTDPISKQRITDPVRNRTCNHVYQKETILVHIRQAQSGQARCPYVGCSNKKVTAADLMEDRELKKQLMQDLHSVDVSLMETEDEDM